MSNWRNWISVKERMPAIGLRVLVYHRRRQMEVGERVAGGFGWFRLASGAYSREVTHWMDMPEPPENERV